MVDKWTYFIKYAQKLEVIPDDIEDEGLITAYKEADKHSWKKEDLIAYDNASMREQDERGREQKAREEGGNEKEIEAVLGLNKNNVAINIIALSLNISEERVVQIIENYSK